MERQNSFHCHCCIWTRLDSYPEAQRENEPDFRDCESHLVMSDYLWPHGLYSPWNSPGSVLEWVAFPFLRGSSQPKDHPRSPALQVDSLPAEPRRKPKIRDCQNSCLQLIPAASGCLVSASGRRKAGARCQYLSFLSFILWAEKNFKHILSSPFTEFWAQVQLQTYWGSSKLPLTLRLAFSASETRDPLFCPAPGLSGADSMWLLGNVSVWYSVLNHSWHSEARQTWVCTWLLRMASGMESSSLIRVILPLWWNGCISSPSS